MNSMANWEDCGIPEFIRSAAIEFYIDDELYAIESNCHANCMMSAYERFGTRYMNRDKTKDRSGFVLNPSGRFVDRVEALEIAKKRNQLKDPNYDKTWLDSYAVNFRR